MGIYVLAQLGYNPRLNKEKTLELYFKLLKEQNSSKIIAAILSSIGHNNECLKKEYISELVKFKNHKYSTVRFELTLAFAGVENEIAIDTLIYLSNDKHPDVRNYSTWAIGTQLDISSKTIINALWNRVDDFDWDTRTEAIFGLAKRKDKRIGNILAEELKEINNQGSQILESIEELNDKGFIGKLEKQIKANKLTQKVNEKWLLKTMETLKENQKNTITNK